MQRGLVSGARLQTMKLAEEDELVDYPHAGVQTALLGHIAEPASLTLPDRGAAPEWSVRPTEARLRARRGDQARDTRYVVANAIGGCDAPRTPKRWSGGMSSTPVSTAVEAVSACPVVRAALSAG
jgi:hypothetical protein